MNVKGKYITIILLFITLSKTEGQTCCSGGTPFTGNLGIQGLEAKSWYFQLGYDYNFLDDLYTGTEKLKDNTRERLTQTVFLQTIYAFSQKFSTNVLFSYVDQKRTIFSSIGETNITSANGLGDVVLLAQYTLFSNLKRSFTIAAGPKLPVGKFNAVDPVFGLVLSTDLQPGSGSVDGILGGSFSESHLFDVTGLTFNSSAGYRLTTAAKRFAGDNNYRFGSETMFSLGFLKNFILNKTGITPSLFFRYRHTSSDKIEGFDVAGTGGNWIYLNSGLTIEPTNNWSVNIAGELPIYRNLKGTQTTTSFRINMGLAIKLFRN